jgi:hypothetical protein
MPVLVVAASFALPIALSVIRCEFCIHVFFQVMALRKYIEADVIESILIETIRDLGESTLVFGKESEELKQEHREISYASEVYEFLLFQLANDLESDYKELADALRNIKPDVSTVEPLLRSWFEETTQFVNIKEPKQFISKIRKPCGEACDGELCGWDGKVCKVKLNASLQKERLFHRLLTTMTENSKIRAVVLDGRSTPFFSTILYLELPHEVIMTDTQISA